MRGGTSKGVFLHARDLPQPGAERDRLLLGIMGSPDPMQIDGMGGTYSSTSKVVVVEPGPGGAIRYWFAQVGVDRAIVDWSGNCGNLTTAVAPFAIDEGLVPALGPLTRVRLVNGNTGVEIEADVETLDGRAMTSGRLAIAGVPGTGSPVVTRYLDPSGGVLGRLLPTGNAVDRLPSSDGGAVRASIVDAAHPYVFVGADAVGIDGSRTVAELDADGALLDRVERIRAAASVLVGAAADADDATRSAPATPRIILVSAGDDGADVTATAFSMGRVHRALPMTGALCLAAAATIPGTVVDEVAAVRPMHRDGRIRIRHPQGVTEVVVEQRHGSDPIRSLGVIRTARRLMEGRVYPREGN
ncbi:3-methylitaconate isomerase [Agromyces bracchium]|uniref:3-methylitaconate isomerase n=2 Tax=Agromyces bracchium TaxID=88376 RepID=A0A6I3MD18_9MICO|nr:3-methylitaconate isomerase [Agromyces bracchium]